jgi:hypothetical protein
VFIVSYLTTVFATDIAFPTSYENTIGNILPFDHWTIDERGWKTEEEDNLVARLLHGYPWVPPRKEDPPRG